MRNKAPPLFRPAHALTREQQMATWRAQQEKLRPRPDAAARGYNADWRQIRAEVLAAEPGCRLCAADGIQRTAIMVDHIVPVRERPELRLERSNLQPLCWRHHALVTNRHDGGFGAKRRPR